MTTRAASRAATNSTATSVASAESRRSSLADGANVSFVANGMDEEDERPAKRTRRSLKSNASSTSNGSERAVARETNGVDFADNSSQSSSRSSGKRKRNSDIATSIELAVKPVEAPTEEAPQEQEDPENAPPANRRVPPIKRGRGRRPKALQVDTPTYSTDVGSALPSPTLPPENGGPVDGMADGQTQPAKRLPGRRRAPHANPSIEADLRRQLQLKMGYRQVAKMHKVILAELSRRSINEINNDPEAHKRSSQFEVVQKALDDRLALRLQRLESFYEHKKASIERVRTAEQEIQKQMFEVCAIQIRSLF